MKHTVWMALASLVGLGLTAAPAEAQGPQVGDLAPDFTLQASDGRTYTLSALRGRHVVLAWFPKAFTAG